MRDQQWLSLPRRNAELSHGYGDHVHLLTDPLAARLLARLGSPDCVQPEANRLLAWCYRSLLDAVLRQSFPIVHERHPTRMAATTPDAVYEGQLVDDGAQVVIAALARAGTLPSHLIFEQLTELLDPKGVRIDHVYLNRATDADGKVVGVNFSGSKVGGPVQDAILLVPDPMGATGGSVSYVLDHYRKKHGWPGRKTILMHLIITPEYIRRLEPFKENLEIWALRLDRGLSPETVLQARPGTQEGERGLNHIQYIVPGAGGLGELINNAYV